MNYEVYHIPSNFTDAGRIMGLFELRNLVEAVILTVPALYLCIAFLPFGLTAKIIVTLVVVVPVGGFGLIGINDDSMTRWLGYWWQWRRRRRIILFRGEVSTRSTSGRPSWTNSGRAASIFLAVQGMMAIW